MTNQQIKKEFKKIFHVLMFGNPLEFKMAKRDIEKLWNKDYEEFSENAYLVFNYMDQFAGIKSSKNQAAFASGLSLFFLALADNNFEGLKNFVLKVIQNPAGDVREAIRKTADWLYISLTERMDPFVEGELSLKQKKEQKEAENQFSDYLGTIEYLIEKYADEEKNTVKYVKDLKPSVFKSLQLLWMDLTRGRHIRLDDNPSEKILAKREEIKREFSELFKNSKYDFDFDDVLDAIYYEFDTDDFRNVLTMFDQGQNMTELQNIVDMVSDAWNYFPHKTLGGKSPHQMVNEGECVFEKKKQETNNIDMAKLLKIVCAK